MLFIVHSAACVRHFDAMAAALVRAGRARGVVADCLASGRREEAHALCQKHYNNSNNDQDHAAKENRFGADGPTTVKTKEASGKGGWGRAGAGAESGERLDGPSSAETNPRTDLERFAKEFGLELPSTEAAVSA